MRQSHSISRPDLAGSRGKRVSTYLELISPDAVDDHDFCCALPCSLCSTTCYYIVVWAVESSAPAVETDYTTGTDKSRYAGVWLELPTPRWIADQGFRVPSALDILCIQCKFNKNTLFSSSRFVNITILPMSTCQIILQKSLTLSFVGPTQNLIDSRIQNVIHYLL